MEFTHSTAVSFSGLLDVVTIPQNHWLQLHNSWQKPLTELSWLGSWKDEIRFSGKFWPLSQLSFPLLPREKAIKLCVCVCGSLQVLAYCTYQVWSEQAKHWSSSLCVWVSMHVRLPQTVT